MVEHKECERLGLRVEKRGKTVKIMTHMPTCVSYPLGYSTVLATECLEAVDKVLEDVCQGHSGPIIITTPNERLYMVRLSLIPGNQLTKRIAWLSLV